MEILFDSVAISQSPIRVMITNRDCEREFGSRLTANEDGMCVCAPGTYDVGDICKDTTIFMIIIFSCALVVFLVMFLAFLNYKRQKSDHVWHIGIDELQFDEPPEVIGQGGFGVLVPGLYKGTNGKSSYNWVFAVPMSQGS
ncbi:Guanylate cyclase [Seminavis robusta]|uniref:Guanylate cyclase n=1 Tax=Seminavis robusta TaxID=568900 RepID=A0A9N8DU33_9STRA|nr:Guanylate cyclase [Seminavis robusta]|eukprot:Sro357_g125540.1 Guanylate cyclase (141) ;mRNA; r:13490-13912